VAGKPVLAEAALAEVAKPGAAGKAPSVGRLGRVAAVAARLAAAEKEVWVAEHRYAVRPPPGRSKEALSP
jgi:hypothetical protein